MQLWPVEHLLTIFVITFALLLHSPKSDGKYGQEMFNWSELHSERSNFLQNRDFSAHNITVCEINKVKFLYYVYMSV
jgi:hypothetical protein